MRATGNAILKRIDRILQGTPTDGPSSRDFPADMPQVPFISPSVVPSQPLPEPTQRDSHHNFWVQRTADPKLSSSPQVPSNLLWSEGTSSQRSRQISDDSPPKGLSSDTHKDLFPSLCSSLLLPAPQPSKDLPPSSFAANFLWTESWGHYWKLLFQDRFQESHPTTAVIVRPNAKDDKTGQQKQQLLLQESHYASKVQTAAKQIFPSDSTASSMEIRQDHREDRNNGNSHSHRKSSDEQASSDINFAESYGRARDLSRVFEYSAQMIDNIHRNVADFSTQAGTWVTKAGGKAASKVEQLKNLAETAKGKADIARRQAEGALEQARRRVEEVANRARNIALRELEQKRVALKNEARTAVRHFKKLKKVFRRARKLRSERRSK